MVAMYVLLKVGLACTHFATIWALYGLLGILARFSISLIDFGPEKLGMLNFCLNLEEKSIWQIIMQGRIHMPP
jgi:hypothetical protein